MFSFLRQYAFAIIGVQFAALLLLGYLLYGSYTQWEVETKVERDTTVVTKKDTVWGGFDIGVDFDDLEPARVITETETDTLVKEDTVYVTRDPGVTMYNEDFSRTLSSGGTISGTITSRDRKSVV